MNAVTKRSEFFDRLERRREAFAWLCRQEDKEGIIGDALADLRASDVMDYMQAGDHCALGRLVDEKVMAIIQRIKR